MSMDDDSQRTRIARADPAASLPGLRDHQLTNLAEEAMTRTDIPPRPTRSPRRALLIGALASSAAAVLIAVAVFALPLVNRAGDPPTVYAQVPGGVSMKCMEPTGDAVREFADTGFRAEVTGIADGTVTLAVTEVLLGDPGTTIEVAQGDGMISDGGPLVFEDGTTYLLAVSDGTILSCGLSGPATPDLEAIYAQAFG
jgi:hypothetical protein